MAKKAASSSDPPVMSWQKLLSSERLQPLEHANGARSPFIADQDIIINSQPFRRLQDKTQVHPLSDNDHVRRRLTHSVEVASIGRALGRHAAKRLLANDETLASQGVSQETFGDILYAACLAHDIGNPPFGHFGEDAIRTAFSRVIENPLCEALTEQQKADLCYWEGNAHGFRVLNSLEKYGSAGGMRLTVATLATFAKYPWSSVDCPQDKRKFGFFEPEEGDFGDVARRVGLIRHSDGGWCRHPLAYLVEAADDLAYAIGDLEDGLELNLVSFDEIETIFRDLIRRREATDRHLSARHRLEFLREDVVQIVVEDVAEKFVKQHRAILGGNLRRDLWPSSRFGTTIETAKKLTAKKIFQAPQKAGVEVASFEVLGTLIDKISTALLTLKRGGKRLREHTRLIEFTLGREQSWIAAQGDYGLLLTTADYVAGMTDSFATKVYRHITGIDFSVGR